MSVATGFERIVTKAFSGATIRESDIQKFPVGDFFNILLERDWKGGDGFGVV